MGSRMRLWGGLVLLPFALAATAIVSCAQEEYPLALWEAQNPPPPEAGAGTPDSTSATSSPDAASDSVGTPLVPGPCNQSNAQPLPQRLVTMSASAAAGNNLIYASDLFTRFNAICGACHGPAADPPGLGSFRIANPTEFLSGMTKAVLAHITSNGPSDPSKPIDPSDPLDPMPPFSSPSGGPYSKRQPTDPIVQLATLVQAWLAAGSPTSFTLSSAQGPGAGDDGGAEAGTASPYRLSPVAGNAMTNIGTCVPTGPVMALASQQKKSSDLDAMFAGLSKQQPGPTVTPAQLVGLPEHLSDTDLFTFDSNVLSQYGVVAFQPAYPLWSDDAGKLRYVRVPMGQSIQFDKARQEFVIPDNTRFYKTFMKQIVDTDGSIRWRKIETRLIVARHDTQNADGTATVNALFGSYLWNADESDAVLIETPLIDGLPFADTLLLFTTDEQLAADLLSQNPRNPDEVLVAGGAARHYAVPSSDRCVQCHMGSPSQSFVLGFRPVQINRRPAGQGGTLIEPNQQAPTSGELTQLQRFIDYGVVSGIASPSDVLPLEQSQGSRQPRDDQELTAQGYMLGNCVHCHNPRGFPSVTNPVLVDAFNLLPGPTGGIFQFSLERTSPRIQRGLGGTVPIAYITPSLVDLSSSPKFWLTTAGDLQDAAYAPWRSLIYRNVDTPFTYTEDYGLFPHMPMNSPGYDCRVRQIMSDWMVSIPAIRKNPQIPEYTTSAPFDDTPQPYVEVSQGMPGYSDAKQAATQRLAILHSGTNPALPASYTYSRYSDCPDTSDILDPAVVRDPTCHPIPTAPTGVGVGTSNQDVNLRFVEQRLNNFPQHAQWVVTDLTQVAGPYSPRRPDWPSVLVGKEFPPPAIGCQQASLTEAQNAQDEVKIGVDILQDATLDGVRSFLTQNVPMGLWQKKSGCSFSSVPTVSSYTGSLRPQWMDTPAAHASAGDPVYAEWPGAAVFNMICVNCHGTQFDSHGRLSDNLLVMTGGNARVADFRDGLFGPATNPGANRQGPFGAGALPSGVNPPGWTSASVDDRAARYMAWMANGGTEVAIPLPVLQIISNTSVLGVTRLLPTSSISANMLAVAKSLCYSILFGDLTAPQLAGGTAQGQWFRPDSTGTHETENPALITANGDAELWLRLCSVDNPPPVRAAHGSGDGTAVDRIVVSVDPKNRYYSTDLFPQSVYGANPVGNDRNEIDPGGITADNLRPWCFRKSSAGPGQTPLCPDGTNGTSVIDNGDPNSAATGANDFPTLTATLEPTCTNGCWGPDEADRWATRGAINAGFAVFLYLDAVTKGTIPRLPDYTQCEQLH